MSQSPIDDFSATEVMRYRQGWKALNRLLHQERSFSGREANRAFLNMGSGQFADISAASGLDFLDDGRAVTLADWDFDGDLDIWITNRTAPRVRFLRNNLQTQSGHVSIKLQGNGRSTNRDAIGARVELHVEDEAEKRLVKTLHAGDGFLSQSSSWIHFGLGSSRVRELVVHWPGGARESFRGLAPGGFYVVEQGSGSVVVWTPPPQLQPLVASTPKLAAATAAARIVLPARLPFPQAPYTDDRGQVVTVGQPTEGPLFVNLWGSWCAPCIAELGDWTKHVSEIQSQGLDIVALSMDELDASSGNVDAANDLLNQLNFPFRRGFASQQLVRNMDLFLRATLDLWRPLPVPSSCLLDKHGRVVVIYLGNVGTEQLLADLQLLDASPRELRHQAVPFPGVWITDPPPPDPLRVCSQFIDHQDIAGGVSYLERFADSMQDGILDETNSRQLGDIYYVLATLLGEQRQQDAAVEAFRQAATFNPEDVRIRKDFASLLLQLGKPAEAAEQLVRALQIQPNNVAFLQMLATVRYGQKQFGKAVEYFARAVAVDPNDVASRLNLASAYRSLGDYQSAVATYRATLQRQPENALALNNLAWILATYPDPSIRDGEEAVQLATRLAQGAGRRTPNAWGTLGAALAETGEFQKAVSAVEQAIRLAQEKGDTALLEKLTGHMQTYQSQRPHREGGSNP